MEGAAERRDAKLFWTMGRFLLKYSRAFRMAALCKAVPFWYYKFTAAKIDQMMMAIQRRIRKDDTRLELSRLYILKADGVRKRPLGVPEVQ
jgi:hypothetical protein